MDKLQRVIVYVDGFNFYYGLKTKGWGRYYWIDIVKLFEQFLKPHQELTGVNYFSAAPTNQGKKERQNQFFLANKMNPKFNLWLGNYKPKNIICRNCNTQIKSWEEKQTDVQIATKMIRDVVLDNCDISILVTADSDIIPPIDLIREISPTHKIFSYFPPNRFSFELKNKANNFIYLHNHEAKFKNAVMEKEIFTGTGRKIIKPELWA